MPPAASICIISEVPERGNPETVVIIGLRSLSVTRFVTRFSALILHRHFCPVNSLPAAGLEDVNRAAVDVNGKFFSVTRPVPLGFIGEKIRACGQRERSEIGEAIAFHGAGFRRGLLLGDFLVTGECSGLAPKNSI